MKDRNFARLHLERRDADHITLGVANDVERHPFDKERGVALDVLLIERVQHRVTRAVSGGTGAGDRLLAVLGAVAAERALIDRTVRVTVERHAHVFELVDDLRCLAAHELDGILVAEPVGALDGVVEVVVPVVLVHIAERGTDTALRRDCVRARREHLGEHGDAQACARELQGAAHPGATGAYHHCIVFVN